MNSAQTVFKFMGHGGKRKGAGRKKIHAKEPAHVARPSLNARTPFHGGLKLRSGLPNLRTPEFLEVIAKAFVNANAKGLRINQFSIESNHIHLIGEADDNGSVTRGMLSITATITWALRKSLGRLKKVFESRYFVHVIKAPREMRNALQYVLFNHAKHLKVRYFADVYSSAHVFEDLHFFIQSPTRQPRWTQLVRHALSEPKSWLQTVGWKRRRGSS